ncbi:MAG: glycosyltransferase family 39 protein [Novosphingobium sp.]|nr:glycosyltransferase family 39 protein [Novosphingobium sp.]
MTEPRIKVRNRLSRRVIETALLSLTLLAALALRLDGVDFGLPALNDPDEPLFMMTAFEMLRNQSLNPGWFGHPATVTLYCLALVMLAVGGIGIATGRFADADAFAAAVYADPGIVFLPARLFIVACGVACVYLTWRIGKRLGGAKTGLIAALFLAVNAAAIEYSQIIRTDMQATAFMLLCALCALAILNGGKLKHYLLAGVFVGLACATKWPAAVIGLSPLCAGLYRVAQGHRERGCLGLFVLSSAVTLFLVSPFLLLDYPTVLENLSGEARPIHPGATGGGFFDNLGWYIFGPLLSSLGAGGLLFAAIGLVWAPRGQRDWLVAVLPTVIAFVLMICLQALRWERWIVPLLPFLAIAAARGLSAVAHFVRTGVGGSVRRIETLAALVLALLMIQTARVEAVERTHDTRQIASAWVRSHVPPGSTVLLEHAAFDLLQGPWTFRFPLASAGCVDAKAALSGRIRYSRVERLRSGSPIVDLGHVETELLSSCRADYAILTHYDRYRENPGVYTTELGSYERILAKGVVEATIRPRPGHSSGPVVRIVKLRPWSDGQFTTRSSSK